MSINLTLSDERTIDAICRTFDLAWRSGATPRIGEALEQLPSELRGRAFEDLVAIDWERRIKSGLNPDIDAYRSEFVEFAQRLTDEYVSDLQALQAIVHLALATPTVNKRRMATAANYRRRSVSSRSKASWAAVAWALCTPLDNRRWTAWWR